MPKWPFWKINVSLVRRAIWRVNVHNNQLAFILYDRSQSACRLMISDHLTRVFRGGKVCIILFVPVLIQFSGQISSLSETDLYFTEIYKITISLCKCSASFLKEACIYMFLPLSPLKATLNQIQFYYLHTEHCCYVCPNANSLSQQLNNRSYNPSCCQIKPAFWTKVSTVFKMRPLLDKTHLT